MYLCLVLFSCGEMETVVNLEIPPHESVLVLNANFNTDNNVQLSVSNSVGAFDNSAPIFLTDAEVLLYKENEQIDALTPDLINPTYVYYRMNDYASDSVLMYYYKSNVTPQPNSNYKIVVNHPNYNSIQAKTFIPDSLNIYNVEVDTTSNENIIGLRFSFDDAPNQQNYYRLKLFSSCTKSWVNEYGDYDEWDFSGYTEFVSNDPSFPAGIPFNGYTFEGNNVIFTDALFNGQKKTIELDVITEEIKYADCDTVIIEFSIFSDDTYSYYSSLDDHREKGELNIFGGEVVPVYSNVENGLGVFISNNSQKIRLKP